jgi:hypothetical protein
MIKKIEKGTKTPLIIVDTDSALIKISGVIIPENPIPLFDEIMSLTKLATENNKVIQVEFDLEYFNTGAARYIYDYLKNLKLTSTPSVKWFYEKDDEDIFESGQEFSTMTGIDFHFIEKQG